MSWLRNTAKQLALPLVFSLCLVLLVDAFFGDYVLERIRDQRDDKNQQQVKTYRTKHPIYHHTFRKGFRGKAIWGDEEYKLCTSLAGFKQSCSKPPVNTKQYDIGIIGDSFTEGAGLRYEDTFVGQIAAALPHRSIANLGVLSYSPSIYLAKIKHLLTQGFHFKEIVVYIDSSDIQDEVLYKTVNGRIVKHGNEDTLEAKKNSWQYSFETHLPLSFQAYQSLIKRIRRLRKEPTFLDRTYLRREYARSAWTYNLKVHGYGEMGASAAIKKSLAIMRELYTLLQQKGIKLSIGVYPWPAQLLYDNHNSLQVQIWKRFCKQRCHFFSNSFPTFFRHAKKHGPINTIKRFYIDGDVHYNLSGNRLIAQDFLRAYTATHTPQKK